MWEESENSWVACRGYTQWKDPVRESVKQLGMIHSEKYMQHKYIKKCIVTVVKANHKL